MAMLLDLAKKYAKWRTQADLAARPLGPIPKRKKRPAPAPNTVVAPATTATNAPAPGDADADAPPKKKAASELLSSYGAYASYGAAK